MAKIVKKCGNREYWDRWASSLRDIAIDHITRLEAILSVEDKATGDGGIDGVINEDELGLDAVYIQAKRYDPSYKVGRPDLQRFVGSLTGEGASKGVFVTTSISRAMQSPMSSASSIGSS